MAHNLEDTIVLLAHTPAALNSLLRDLPESWTLANEGENTWSAFDIVGHLLFAEGNNWITRTKHILEFGETRAFQSFNRLGQVEASRGKSLAQLLDEFARARSENLAELRSLNLRPEDLDRRGLHPSLGRVTLSQLLATWAAHDLTHLHQLTRVLACQYRETVGPFDRFLGVLKCEGHSDSA
jgi:DinB superfamily